MKKIILAILLLGSFIDLSAADAQDKMMVEKYIKVSYILTYGKPFSSDDDEKDGVKYAKKALSWMEKNKMDMNGLLASDVYERLAAAYNPGMIKDKEHQADTFEYANKAYEIRKKLLGENHPKTKEILKRINLWNMFKL